MEEKSERSSKLYNPKEMFDILNNLYERDKIQDFLRWRDQFKMFDFTFTNQCLLFGQANSRQLTPIFQTVKQWYNTKTPSMDHIVISKTNGVAEPLPCEIIKPCVCPFLSIKGKEKLEEFNKFKLCDPDFSKYFKDKIVRSSMPYKAKNGEEYIFFNIWDRYGLKNDPKYKWGYGLVAALIEKCVEMKIGKKESKIEYFKRREMYSIDQTDFPEEDRADYIKRFDTKDYNPEEGKKIYTQLQAVANGLGLNVVEDNENHAYIGYASWIHNNMIYILNTMPIESKVKVLSHELGHFVLQKNIKDFESKYSRDRSIYEIQAELFASLFTSYFDILNKDEIDENGEKHKTYSDFSHFYISGYMKSLKKSLSLVENDSNFKNLHELTQAECDEIRSNAVKDLFFKQFDICDRASKLLINACEAVETSDSEKFLDNIKKLESFPGYDFAWQPKYKNWYMIANKEILPMTQDFNNRGDIYREKALEEIKEKDEAKANKQIIEADKTIEMEM